MDDSMYNHWRNHDKFVDDEDKIVRLPRSKQKCCDHDFRKRRKPKSGWSHICIECGVKERW